MAPPSDLPHLPASVEGITDEDSLLEVVSKLAICIHKVINEGKSVSATNKRLISTAAEEIRKATRIFPNLRQSDTNRTFTVQESDDTLKKDIVACVRDEVSRQLDSFSKRQEKRLERSYAQTVASISGTGTGTGNDGGGDGTSTSVQLRRLPGASAPIIAPVTRPAIVVTPKVQPETREDAVRQFRDCINFKISKYAPAKIQPLSNHKLRVEFDSIKHMEDALLKLNASTLVSAEPARKLKPMFILKGISMDTSSEQLVDIIKEQNSELNVENEVDLQLRFKRNNRNPKLYNAVFQASPIVWRKVIEKGRLSVDFQQVHAGDFSPFIQCHHCLQFGHTKNKCTVKNSPCAYCAAGDHLIEACPERERHAAPKCFNCHAHNSKFNIKSDVRHTATSEECPRLVAMKKRITCRIDYGSTQ